MNDTLRIQQMRQFVIAAESGSFRAAAAATFRSAAAVSTAMAELEQQVGAPLFEKGQRARLTPLGQTLAPLFAELLRTHDRVVRDVRQMARAERGLLTVAVVPFLAEEWFSGVLGRFMRTHGNVTVRVIDQRSRQARQMVSDGLADIAVVSHLGDDPKLDFHPVAIDTFGIVCRSDDPLARGRRRATWKVLAKRSLIGNDALETIYSRGLGQWVENNVAVMVSSRLSIMNCIRQGIGITVLPRLTQAAVGDRHGLRAAHQSCRVTLDRHRHAQGPDAAAGGARHVRADRDRTARIRQDAWREPRRPALAGRRGTSVGPQTGGEGLGGGLAPRLVRYGAASTTVLRSTPIFGTSISSTSPGFIHFGSGLPC